MLHRVIRYAVERRRLGGDPAPAAARRRSSPGRTPGWSAACCPRPCWPTPGSPSRPGTGPAAGRACSAATSTTWSRPPTAGCTSLVGDVCGRGPDEAALGVCLRVAWRTMVLAGRRWTRPCRRWSGSWSAERQHDRMFTTAVRAVHRPRPRAAAACTWPAIRRRCCWPDGSCAELSAPTCLPLGIAPDHATGPAARSSSAPDWSVLMYTDGLIEGRIGDGHRAAGRRRADRAGTRPMLRAGRRPAPGAQAPRRRAAGSAGRAGSAVLNGGELDDDLAVLAVGYPAGGPAMTDQTTPPPATGARRPSRPARPAAAGPPAAGHRRGVARVTGRAGRRAG